MANFEMIRGYHEYHGGKSGNTFDTSLLIIEILDEGSIAESGPFRSGKCVVLFARAKYWYRVISNSERTHCTGLI